MKTIIKTNKSFELGQKVIVNTGGDDSEAIIDYPTLRKDLYGKERGFKITVNGQTSYLCRFTNDVKKCYVGGATRLKDYHNSGNPQPTPINFLFENAQYIPEQYIYS